MKQLMLVLTLLVCALAPVSAQVQIDTGLTPSETALDVISDHVSASKLLGYLFETVSDESCVAGEMVDTWNSIWVTACVFYDPIDPRLIFMALVDEESRGADAIYLFRNGEIFRQTESTKRGYQSFMLVSDLPDGEYEVVFIAEGNSGELSTAFYFWIDEQKEDSD